MNKHLKLHFFRAKKDIEITKNKSNEAYPVYLFENEEDYTTYTLIKNKCKVTEALTNESSNFFSFDNSRETIRKLILEYKNVDYFLKIETDNVSFKLQELINNILIIPEIITAYKVDHNTIKGKTNLIFE